MSYDFKSLSSADFEELTRDLLQAELDIRLESFKAGKDGGIDLRYSKNDANTLIVQCKHYSDFNSLIQTLKTEVSKVEKLKPIRYILVTSVNCNPQQKDQIKNLFSPFITSTTEDIFCQSDLNNLINRHPEIEKQHFKLWLTSTNVLQKILQSKIFTQSETEIDYIKKKIKLYVPNLSFSDAEKILAETHYCIIAGIPGIGKTTLAEILLVFYINQGYEAIKISGDIDEGFAVYNSETKQIFYYDDFLGQTSFSEKLNKNEDQRILRFIELVNKAKNARLILTTREYILNSSKLNYEKLARSSFDIQKCTLDLSNYTLSNKSKILFNHLYFSSVPQDYIENLLSDRFYQKIISHPNYSPRIIEWMTDIVQIKGFAKDQYTKAFLFNLDNPEKIWEHAFDNQLSRPSRYLLYSMLIFSRFASLSQLEDAFINFYEYDAQKYRFEMDPNDFKKALKELDGNFLRIGTAQFIEFHNPSILDFLKQKIKSDFSMAKSLIDSVKHFRQLQSLMPILIDVMKVRGNLINVTIKISDRYLIEGENLQKKAHNFENSLQEALLSFLLEFREKLSDDIDETINRALSKVYEKLNSQTAHKNSLVKICNQLKQNPGLKKYLAENFLNAVREYLLTDIDYIDDLESLIEFHKLFPQSFSSQENDHIAETFTEIGERSIQHLVSDDEENVDSLNQQLVVLEDISDYLKTPLSNFDVLENYIFDLESAQEMEEAERSSFELNTPEEFRDNDIDNLFELLKHRKLDS